jgi:RHS repeat-associated protein
MRSRWSVQVVVVSLTASLAAVVAPSVAAGVIEPSVPLPQTGSVAVDQQTRKPREQDAAARNALRNDQGSRTAQDGAGTPTATNLSPTATWEVAPHTGDFTWSYPLRVPPAPGGLEPELALSYRSSAVDGRTSVTNNQPSWVGDGWDLSPGFIERAYGGCSEDADGITPPKTGDLCWRSDNATAVYAGGGGMLICCDSGGKWRSKRDDGSRIERFTGLGNGDNDGEHWKITTLDGTEYWFGSQVDSRSTWTVPVFGDDAGEPCHAAAFDGSRCVQAWRWNLDKIVDRNGNLIRYFYDTEQNSYGLNMKDTAASYVRGGTLRKIEYGLHTTVAGAATGLVEFAVADRCVPGSACTSDKPANWPDVPWDNKCDAATCTVHAPSFWSTKRLASVTTKVRRGSDYDEVDRWDLDQQYPDPGDGEKAALWLKGITHTGLAGDGPSIALEPVTFEGAQYPNRVYSVGDGYAMLNRYRITGVISESGGIVSINYAPTDCKAGVSMPANPQTNGMRCFPVRWAPKGHEERTDYFHKYVVAAVIQSDWLSTSTQQETRYEYLDGAGWHWDLSEFVKDDKKSWNEFRGFKRVRIRGGSASDPGGSPVSLSEQRFYRGMNGDKLPGNGVRSESVSDSEGGVRTDHDWLQGFGYETITYQSDSTVVSKSITDPVWRGPTATRGPFQAYINNAGTQRELTALASGGWRTTKTVTSYDDRGLVEQVSDLGDVAVASDDRCTRTWYVRNTDRWLIDVPARDETVAVSCDTAANFPAHAINDLKYSHDGNANRIRTEVAKERPAAGPIYVTTGSARFDAYGRMIESTDALGQTTKSAITPATGGPVTATTTTSPGTPTIPGGLVTTKTVDPAFGLSTMEVDPNWKVTETAYDALGRVTKVWLPDRYREDYPNQGSAEFTYLLRRSAPTVVTASMIGPNGVATKTNNVFDGLLRPRQVQKTAAGGGRLIVDTRYDSQGRVYKATQPYFNNAALDTNLWVASDTEVPGLTRTRYDAAGRVVESVYQAGAFDRWKTVTSYGGDRILVTPPSGGTATTTITNAQGNVVELRQHHGPKPEGGYDTTSYRYTPAGPLSGVTGPDGAVWRFGYDLRGRKITEEDPDAGTSGFGYDDADRLTSVRDGRGKTVFYVYDALGRKTAARQDRSTGQELASWTYDTAIGGKGLPATATRFVGENSYVSTVNSYTAMNKPLQTSITIPGAEGLLAGTYTTNLGYGWNGSQTGERFPAAGGLPEETVNYGLDDWGRPTTTKTASGMPIVAGTLYTRYGEVERLEHGVVGKRAWQSFYYDTSTRRLSRSIVDAEVPRPMQADMHYTYDDAGTITSVADRTLGQTADIQCLRHDYLRRLTEAWTPSSGCDAAPAAGALAGPAPYWHSYTYQPGGNRLTETQRTAAGAVTRVYAYGAGSHALRSVTGPTGTETFDYNPAGQTTGRVKAGVGETFTWDVEGHLESVARGDQVTSFVYSANGTRLLRKDPTGTTLYLNGQEVRLSASGGSPVGTRYYTHGGKTVAMRQGKTVTWLAGDHQGTGQVAINTDTLAVARRRQLPFGGPRGGAVSWPNERGFVGGTIDSSTGLTHLGAREYDPSTGRFISVDPIMDVTDPLQMHGYTYANSSPFTFSDPTGLANCGVDGAKCGLEKKTQSFCGGPFCGPNGKQVPSGGGSSGGGGKSTVTTTPGRAPPPSSSKASKPAAPPTAVSNEQAKNYDEWLERMTSPNHGCSVYMEGCLMVGLLHWVISTAEAIVADARECGMSYDIVACFNLAETFTGPGAVKRGASGVPGSVRAAGQASASFNRFTTKPNDAVFWSGLKGGETDAKAWVARNGGSTLETTIESRGINLPKWDKTNPASVEAWKKASEDFARGASGKVRVLQDETVRIESVWATVEYKALKENPNVTSIVAVNPHTGKETVLWRR